MLRSACSGPRGEELRPLRRRKSGSETPELQSMSCEESQKLRSLEGQPRVAEGGGEHRSQRLRVPVRHGLKFWSLRPRLPTASFRDTPLRHFQTLTRPRTKHLPRSPNTSRQPAKHFTRTLLPTTGLACPMRLRESTCLLTYSLYCPGKCPPTVEGPPSRGA